MMKSPFVMLLSKASWIITALASINVGLMIIEKNIFMLDFFQNNLAFLFMPLHIIIGLAGVWSLVCFFMCGCSCSHNGNNR